LLKNDPTNDAILSLLYVYQINENQLNHLTAHKNNQRFMKAGRVMLIFAGLIGILAFFLPYMTFEKSVLGVEVVNKSMTGYTALRTYLDQLGVLEYDKGKVLTELVLDYWNSANSGKDYLLFMGLVFTFAGPIIFMVYSVSYLIKGLIGQRYKRGFFFTVIYVAAAWATFMFLTQDTTTVLFGKDIGVKFEFLKMVNGGFWLTIGSMVLAGVSYFFDKPAKG
jgi:hypothetical protein